ncbi:MAG: patatin-like phospholipase family protein [Myxococcota bacterium]
MLTLLLAAGLLAQTEADPAPASAIVVSGGVSLGAYQAGFLHLFTETLKREARGRTLPLVAGASAGSANAFLAAVSMCLEPVDDPEHSLGWRAWMPVGFDQLYQKGRTRPDGMFSRQALVDSTDMIWSQLEEQGLPDDCDFVLGVSTTRIRLHRVRVQQSLRIPRQEEKFLVRVQGRGSGRPPRFSNYVDPYSDVEQPILPFESTDDPFAARRDFERFRSLLFASMAFPIAFPPQWVSHCLTDPPGAQGFVAYRDARCELPTEASLFVDGGVLDNSPLRLAYQTAETGLRMNGLGQPVWRDLAESGWSDRRPSYTRLQYHYLDPSLTVFPDSEASDERERSSGVLGLANTLFMNFVTAARSKELYTLAEDRALVTEQMRISHRHYPSASDPLWFFMGFFERDFRAFDFHLGMYDAYRHLGADPQALPFPVDTVDAVPSSLWPFACMLGWLEEDMAHLRPACRMEGMEPMRILLQVSLDRLWDQCRRYQVDTLPLLSPHPYCIAAAAEENRPWLLDGKAPPDDGRAQGEWHFKYVMRRLAAYDFVFEDLGLRADEAGRGSAVVRGKLLRAMEELADRQEGELNRTLVASGGRVIANELAYEVPPLQGGVLIGSDIEGLLLFAPFDRARSWFRFSTAVLFNGWASPLAPGPNYLGVVLAGGPEFMIPPLTGSFVQTAFGVRAGRQFSTEDSGGFDACVPRPEQEDPRLCSQTFLQPYVAFGLIDRFRVQVGLDVYPETTPSDVGPSGARFEDNHVGLDFGVGLLF